MICSRCIGVIINCLVIAKVKCEVSDWTEEIKERQSGWLQKEYYLYKRTTDKVVTTENILFCWWLPLLQCRESPMFPIITISRVPSTGALRDKQKHDVNTLNSEEAPLLSSLPFLPMISISNSPCFASELHACVHAITALQVVACPTSQKSSLCACVYASTRVQVCLWECLFVARGCPEGCDLFTQLRVSLRDSFVYKCNIIINFSVFVVLCFDRPRLTSQWLDSHCASWKSTKSLLKCLPAGPSKLWWSASQCAQHIKHWNNVSTFCSSCLFGMWKRRCVILS